MNKICDLLNFARHARSKRDGAREREGGGEQWVGIECHWMDGLEWLEQDLATASSRVEPSRDEPSETFPRFTVADKRASLTERQWDSGTVVQADWLTQTIQQRRATCTSQQASGSRQQASVGLSWWRRRKLLSLLHWRRIQKSLKVTQQFNKMAPSASCTRHSKSSTGCLTFLFLSLPLFVCVCHQSKGVIMMH